MRDPWPWMASAETRMDDNTISTFISKTEEAKTPEEIKALLEDFLTIQLDNDDGRMIQAVEMGRQMAVEVLQNYKENPGQVMFKEWDKFTKIHDGKESVAFVGGIAKATFDIDPQNYIEIMKRFKELLEKPTWSFAPKGKIR